MSLFVNLTKLGLACKPLVIHILVPLITRSSPTLLVRDLNHFLCAYVIFVILLTPVSFSADTKNTLIPDLSTPKKHKIQVFSHQNTLIHILLTPGWKFWHRWCRWQISGVFATSGSHVTVPVKGSFLEPPKFAWRYDMWTDPYLMSCLQISIHLLLSPYIEGIKASHRLQRDAEYNEALSIHSHHLVGIHTTANHQYLSSLQISIGLLLARSRFAWNIRYKFCRSGCSVWSALHVGPHCVASFGKAKLYIWGRPTGMQNLMW